MSLLDEFQKIKTFVFDIDGVLTDGSLFIFENGLYVRRMNIRDGFALQLAVKKGYRVVVISGGDAEPVTHRLKKLGIENVFMKVENKLECLEAYLKQQELNWEQVLFMGDDIPDYHVMKMCGMPCCPADAASEIKHISKYISFQKGGDGAARDVLEKVLKLNGHWDLDTGIASK